MWDVESNGSKVQEYVEKSSGIAVLAAMLFPPIQIAGAVVAAGFGILCQGRVPSALWFNPVFWCFLYIAATVEYMFKTNQHECQNHQHIYVVQLQITSTCKYMYAVRFFKDPIMSKLRRVVITPAQEQTQSKTTNHRIHHPLTLCLQFFRLTNPKVKQMYQHSWNSWPVGLRSFSHDV